MTTTDKKKAQRKAKQKERRQKFISSLQRGKAEYLFYEALDNWDAGNVDKALLYLEKAVNLNPRSKKFLNELGRFGQEIKRPDLELKALSGLHNHGLISPEQMYFLCHLLKGAGKYEQALNLIAETLPLIPAMHLLNKKTARADLLAGQRHCQSCLEAMQKNPLLLKCRRRWRVKGMPWLKPALRKPEVFMKPE
jgi:tetratricopeptide (TPR) repeat protein